MKTTIPEKTVTTCDACKVEMTRQNSVHEGSLDLRMAALDFQGQPVADASRHLDLCDRCVARISNAIDAAIKGTSHDR
jgi:hypothetical protein